jgi:cytochrome P450
LIFLSFYHSLQLSVVTFLIIFSRRTKQKTQFTQDIDKTMMFNGMMAELPWLSPILTRLQPRERLTKAGQAAIAAAIENRADAPYRKTIFTKLVAAEEDKKELSLELIEREATSFIVAGSDTTGVTLTYLIYAVLADKDGQNIKEKLLEEIDALRPDFTIADATDLPYLGRVIQETLRLYGAAPGTSHASGHRQKPKLTR